MIECFFLFKAVAEKYLLDNYCTQNEIEMKDAHIETLIFPLIKGDGNATYSDDDDEDRRFIQVDFSEVVIIRGIEAQGGTETLDDVANPYSTIDNFAVEYQYKAGSEWLSYYTSLGATAVSCET